MSKTSQYIQEQSLKDPKFSEAIQRERALISTAIAVRQLREEKSLSQRDFAKLVGKSKSTITRIENAESVPNFNTLATIANATNKNINFAFSNK